MAYKESVTKLEEAPSYHIRFLSTTRDALKTHRHAFILSSIFLTLLTASCMLFGISFWVLVYRIPYAYVTGSPIYMNSNLFYMIAAAFALPTSWFAWTCAADRRKFESYIPTMLIFLGASVVVLTTGVGVGAAFRNQIKFKSYDDFGNIELEDGSFKMYTNLSMIASMGNYEQSNNVRHAWEKIQTRLGCCGIEGPRDWMRYSFGSRFKNTFLCMPPSSCYALIGNHTYLYTNGCLGSMARDVASQSCRLMSLGIAVVLIELTISFYILGVYMSQKTRPQNFIVSA